MNDLETVVETFCEEQRARRNEQLRSRLEQDKSFEQLLLELAALKGFNVQERMSFSAA